MALLCAHNQPERRPTIVEVLELLKGESKEKLTQLENDELFKDSQTADFNEGALGAEDSSDFISEEKEEKVEPKESCT